MGGDSTVEGTQQNPENVPPDAEGSEHEAAGIPEGVAGEAAPDPAGDPEGGGEQIEAAGGLGEDATQEAKTELMTRGQLKQHIYELFNNVAERGRKALGEEEEQRPDAE